MAKVGFFDIRTFETLERQLCNTPFNYNSIHLVEDDKEKIDECKKVNKRKTKQYSKKQFAH